MGSMQTNKLWAIFEHVDIGSYPLAVVYVYDAFSLKDHKLLFPRLNLLMFDNL